MAVGVEPTSSTTSLEPFMSREPSLKSLLLEHVLAEELVGAGAGLPADADDLSSLTPGILTPSSRPFASIVPPSA